MNRTAPRLVIASLCIAAFASLPVAAQDDRAAGLFTEARQLPLVSQSVVVRINGGEAQVDLTQIFANPGAEIAQADYRLHLPKEAVVTAFGFWHDGRFLAAELKERGEARRDHTAAAGEGRATGLLKREGAIHSFSVYPILAGGLQEVTATIVLPVATERGRSHLRLPLDAFLGHARLKAGVIAHLETSEPLRKVGVDRARFVERKRKKRSTELAFATEQPVEIWWAAELPPLLTRAEAVPLDDGSSAVQLRVALNDPNAGGLGPSEIVVLIDASFSMRRRGRALDEIVGRLFERAPAPVRLMAVGAETHEITSRDPRTILEDLRSGRVGFETQWADIETAAERLGCSSSARRCVVITDPQIPGLPAERELETFFLADADELSHFSEIIGRAAAHYQPGVEPTAKLHALADELILPVLEIESIHQGRDELTPVGTPRTRVAVGGQLRLFVESRSSDPIHLGMTVDGRSLEREIRIEDLDPASRLGLSVRRGFYRGLLDDQMADYRRSRDPELKRHIVELSLREKIPTSLTSLHVASPDRVLSRTATPGPLLRRIGLVLLIAGAVFLVAARRWMA